MDMDSAIKKLREESERAGGLSAEVGTGSAVRRPDQHMHDAPPVPSTMMDRAAKESADDAEDSDDLIATLASLNDPAPQPARARSTHKGDPEKATRPTKPMRPIEQIGSAARAKLDALRPRAKRLDEAHTDTQRLHDQNLFARENLIRRHADELRAMDAECAQTEADLKNLHMQRLGIFEEIQALETEDKFGDAS